MAQVFDSSTGETIVRSDLRLPADAQGKELQQTVVRVESFLTEDDLPDAMEFILDERFRERTLQELLDRSVLGSVGVLNRDLANFVAVDLTSETPIYITVLMKHRLYSAEATNKIINRKFTELV